MARMNREILVPYLQDVCALHLAKKKYQDQIAALHAEAGAVRAGAVLRRPPMQEKVSGSVFLLGAILGGYAAVFGLMIGVPAVFLEEIGLGEGGLSSFGSILLVGGFITACVCGVLHLLTQPFINDRIEQKNQQDLRNWALQSSRRRASAEAQCDTISNQIRDVERQISVIDGLLAKAYNANLIPSRYRDIYAAVYLYDWFSTGMSDDMDMALNTYVLEQIKSRLDTIIRNQAEQIINQRTIIANQARTMNMIERNALQMRAKVSRMNESLEKQNMYLKMIDSNVAATRYFAEETYKKWN